jgi:hypothetical protein
MTEKLSAQMEDAAREQFGSIVGSFVLHRFPDVFSPDDIPPEFIERIVGIQLPIRGKLNDLYSNRISILHNVADTILEIQQDESHPITVYGFDAIAELERIDRHEDADRWERLGWMRLGFTAAQGTLAPLPRLLAA